MAAALAVCAVLAAASPSRAEEPAKADKPQVIATVDGKPITEADLALTARDLEDTLAEYPDEQKITVLVNFLINQRLMAAAAEKEKLQDTPEYAQRMALMHERTLRDLYFDRIVRKSVSEDEVRKSYDEIAAKIRAESEVRARHVLVETEEEAKAIIEELKKGGDFAKIAEERSKDPNGKVGGDLGYFGKERMLPAFSEAAFALKPGEISQTPVQTEYGWHVIKVEDSRPRTPPEFDEVRDRIQQNLERTRYFEVIDELKKAAKIEILGEEQTKQ